MKKLSIVALIVVAQSCGGSSAPKTILEADACNQAAQTACTKIFACSDTAFALVKLALMDQKTCETMVVQNCGATGFRCAGGQSYHGDEAQNCKDEFNAQTCAALATAISTAGLSTAAVIASLTGTLPACPKICTGTDAGGN